MTNWTISMRDEVIVLLKQARADESFNLLEALEGLYLADSELSELDFSGLDLHGVYFGSANLTGAKFCNCTLKGAVFSGILQGADFTGADLEEADLSDANVIGACFREANLRYTDLTAVSLEEADLTGVRGLATPEDEMKMLIKIRDDIVKQDKLEMGSWHSVYDDEDESIDYLDLAALLKEWSVRGQSPEATEEVLFQCTTTHCMAGSAQLIAHLQGQPVKDLKASQVGSTLIPSMASYFTVGNNLAKQMLDEFIEGRRPLLSR